jgi:alkaline phosphatase
MTPNRSLDRRAFLKGSTLLLAAGGATFTRSGALLLAADEDQQSPLLRIGMITDLHYADKPKAGNRYYRETLDKLPRAVEQFTHDKVDFTVELGDLVDAAATPEAEKGYLQQINAVFRQIPGKQYYVLGNHCVQTLTKEEFLGAIERERSHYSFDAADRHFVVLDACFRSDGQAYGRNNFHWQDANVPASQLEWLADDLAKTKLPTILFVHQRLDVDKHHSVKNAADVRQVLEGSKRVTAVFQGHSHQNDFQQIAGIHYCTLAAMIEGTGDKNNAFARLDVLPTGALRVTGFVRSKSYEWPAA